VRQIAARQYVLLTKASSDKRQAPSRKPQAASKGGLRPPPAGVGKKPLRQFVTLTQNVGVRQNAFIRM